MLIQIVKNEWRNLTADRSLWWVTFILVVAIGYGVYNGALLGPFPGGNALNRHSRTNTTGWPQLNTPVANGLEPERESRSPYSARYIGAQNGAPVCILAAGTPGFLYRLDRAICTPLTSRSTPSPPQRQKRHS